MNRLFTVVGLAPFLLMAARLAAATPIASDSFNYAAGGLGTANGGSGWTTAWAGGSTNVTSPGLTFGGVGSTGTNKLTTNNDNNGAFRSVPAQVAKCGCWRRWENSGRLPGSCRCEVVRRLGRSLALSTKR